VGASARRGEVLFWVANTGSGIAPEDIPHLFDRFWQTKRGRRTGAGLGLPIAKGIVEAHGGKLWVKSEPARGATFFFTIPTVQPDEQHEGRAADVD
jgi:signal transduction histidine kinase